MVMKQDMTKMAETPQPSTMPVDRQAWQRQLHLSNFVNTYYQFRDVDQLPACKRVLIIGPGQGLTPDVLKWRGYEVTTLDIDETFNPDFVGSVHELNMFSDGEFDAVIASHVLEHLAVPYLDLSLSELARVARFALIYLPVSGRHLQVRLQGPRSIDLSLIIDAFNPFAKPDGNRPDYMEGQHFWEVGLRGFRRRQLKQRMAKFFHVMSMYRNKDWNSSQNFVLRSKFNEGRQMASGMERHGG
jgi:predicted SAM-dependent methyltransferase